MRKKNVFPFLICNESQTVLTKGHNQEKIIMHYLILIFHGIGTSEIHTYGWWHLWMDPMSLEQLCGNHTRLEKEGGF